MSNLGAYQIMTTLAKKVGGPKCLGGIVLAIGAALGIGGKTVYDKQIRKNKDKLLDITYAIKKDATSNVGLQLKKDDKFKVLAVADDAVIIELIGNDDNPHVVSCDLLEEISDYKNDKGGNYDDLY